ncbi:hypothetical protein BO70DRAFT_292265, partial [Aspergillus heteromorphus CBS 117.55]
IITDLISPCWYLTVLGETRRLMEQLRHSNGSQCERLSLSNGLYITRTMYQGTNYVSRISSVPFASPDAARQTQINIPAHAKKLILSTDHIGVRSLYFLGQNSNLVPDGSPWYDILDIPDCRAEAYIRFDGLFSRTIRILAKKPCDASMTWSFPKKPTFRPWNFQKTRNYYRLHHIELNAAVKGIIVCCSYGRTIGIHGFTGRSKAFWKFIDSMNQRLKNSQRFWMFFPLNVNEKIQGAWVRTFKNCDPPSSNPVLLIRTSLKRAVAFGPHPPAYLKQSYEFQCLLRKSDGAVSGIFHDGLDPSARHISVMGVVCDSHRSINEYSEFETSLDPYITPNISPSDGTPVTAWYMTKAPLEGLLEVRTCRDKHQPHRPCLGFLLYYQDGHVESLGQVCWDQDLDREVHAPICIEYDDIAGKEYIKGVQRSVAGSQLNPDTCKLQELPQHGTIAWWFGHLKDRIIIYND